MRVTQVHVKDASSVREFAYREDKNGSHRPDMEDSKRAVIKITWRRMRLLERTSDCLRYWMGTEGLRCRSTAAVTLRR